MCITLLNKRNQRLITCACGMNKRKPVHSQLFEHLFIVHVFKKMQPLICFDNCLLYVYDIIIAANTVKFELFIFEIIYVYLF